MSKTAVLVALSAVFVLGACAKHSQPAEEPVVEPVVMEPVTYKGR